VGLIDIRISPPPRVVFATVNIRLSCFSGDINSSPVYPDAISYINPFHTALVKGISKLGFFDPDMDPFCGFTFHEAGQQLLADFRE
jgi:hypothetical protein